MFVLTFKKRHYCNPHYLSSSRFLKSFYQEDVLDLPESHKVPILIKNHLLLQKLV